MISINVIRKLFSALTIALFITFDYTAAVEICVGAPRGTMEVAVAPQKIEYPCYAATRWADLIVRVMSSREDVTTVERWGRLVGASKGTLTTWCRAAKTSPRRSLELARLLRAFVLTNGSFVDLHEIMDIVDPRTVSRILKRAGLDAASGCHLDCSMQDFVWQQQLIDNERALGALTSLLVVQSGEVEICRAQ